MLILITIKNRLTYDGIQLTLKFLGSFSEKSVRLHSVEPPPPLLLSVHLSSPV